MFTYALVFIVGFFVGAFTAVFLMIWAGRRLNESEERAARDAYSDCRFCVEDNFPQDGCPHEYKNREAFGGTITVCKICGQTFFKDVHAQNERDKKIVNRILQEMNSVARLK